MIDVPITILGLFIFAVIVVLVLTVFGFFSLESIERIISGVLKGLMGFISNLFNIGV